MSEPLATSQASAEEVALPPGDTSRAALSKRVREHVRDRNNPSNFYALRVAPTIPMDPEAIEIQVQDLESRSRWYIFPTMRVVAIGISRLVWAIKRMIPLRLHSEWLLNVFTKYSTRWLASKPALEFMVRHFVIETQIINFIARNCGKGTIEECDLVPTRPDQMGNWRGRNAVIQHDVNVYNFFIDLGESPVADIETPIPHSQIDWSDLDMPELDVKPGLITRFDFGTALYFSMVFMAIFADARVIEKGLNSFQWDEGMMNILANITGDDTFRQWTPMRFPTWFGTPTWDPPRDLHWHMIVHENAYHQLHKLRDAALANKSGLN